MTTGLLICSPLQRRTDLLDREAHGLTLDGQATEAVLEEELL